MTENRFWEIVESVKWGEITGDSVDYKAVTKCYETQKARLLKSLSYNDIKDLQKMYAEKINRLVVNSGKDFCYDGWSDCIAHIVGLGEKQYNANIAVPQRIMDRLDAGDYEESFTYALPYASDLEFLTDDHYVNRARRYIDDIDEYLTEHGSYLSADSKLLNAPAKDTIARVYKAREVCEMVRDHRFMDASVVYAVAFPEYSDPLWQVFQYGIPNMMGELELYRL